MYAYIKGELTEKRENEIVVENHGVGYLIQVPMTVTQALPVLHTEVKIYTYTYVREDALGLFGFLSQEDLNMFRLLITVSGIGPKGALSVLSVMTSDEVRFAVLSEDVKKIEKVPGIGKKTAQRLIVDLKDRMDMDDLLKPETGSDNQVSAQGDHQLLNDAMLALTSLGYSASDALKVLREIPTDETTDVETILKEALKRMAML
jgi:holliday junction DNA helicase RuvA